MNAYDSTSTAIVTPACQYCGGYHQGMCHRVESIEYHGNGTVKKVTLRPTFPVGWSAAPPEATE